MRNIDITGLTPLEQTIEGCKVVQIPAGTTPKNILVQLPGDDGARVLARWSGSPPGLAVDDYVEVRKKPRGRSQYAVIGTSAGTGTAQVILASVIEALGDLIVGEGAGAPARLPAGSDGQVLTADSGEALGVKWGPGGGGGWPFDHELTVDQTNTDADHPTILAAHTAAAADDVLTLGPASYAEAAVTISKNVSVQGRNRRRTLITNPFTVDNSGADITDLYIYVSGGGAFGLKFKSASGSRNIAAEHRNVTDARAVVVEGALTLRDVFARSSGSGTSFALEIAATGAVLLEVDCYLTSGGAGSNYDLYIQTGGFAVLNGCILANGTIGGDTSNVTGWYRDGDGNITFIGEVWLWRSDGFRIKKTDLPTALADANTGDKIKLGVGTYTITGSSLALNKAIEIEGADPERTIITSSLSASPTIDITVASSLRNLTVSHTGGGSDSGPLAIGNVTVTLDNVRLYKTSGAPTNGYALWMYNAGSVTLKNYCVLSCTSGGTQYGIRNDLGNTTVQAEGGIIGGGTWDLYSNQAGSTFLLSGPILSSDLVSWSGTKRGFYLTSTGATVYFSAQRGTLSIYPDLGTTTAAQKMGNLYQASGKDVFANGDEAGLALRTIFAGYSTLTQAEDNFDGSSLDAAWAWAGAPFVTPTTSFSVPSALQVNFGAVNNRAFLYRTTNLGINHKARVCLTGATNGLYVGYRWDDGTDNNYFEAALRLVTLTTWDIILKKRAGGGAVTTTSQLTVYRPDWLTIIARPWGTLYSNWNGDCLLETNAVGVMICQNGYMAGATWTPTRRGLVFNIPAGAGTWEATFVDYCT
ncbi:MAG: hypothetical protein BroJett011_04110 [Chloroflexota bacterium]|nr:MAG: hypothetical protein BroJett011_04110 [Chloroflexota bacterium]